MGFVECLLTSLEILDAKFLISREFKWKLLEILPFELIMLVKAKFKGLKLVKVTIPVIENKLKSLNTNHKYLIVSSLIEF